MSHPAAGAVPPFTDLGLRQEVLRAVTDLGYTEPTRIQAAAIPPLLAGRDVLGQAQTGTGKTAAFALPLLQGLDPARREVQAIVLAPTRELAQQVTAAVRGYGAGLDVRVVAVYGGQSYRPQLDGLRRGAQVVIGTPGRVKDLLARGALDLTGVRFFGLDEADEMLNMGFLDDVEEILAAAPAERQVALFSATMPEPIRRIADRHLADPVDVSVADPSLAVEKIEQLSLRVSGLRDKQVALERILRVEAEETVLVFAQTREACAELTEQLQAAGHDAECVHGGMSQVQRDAVLRRLRAERTRVVVATDVAARGLDVDHIGLVVNYDLPRDREVYVHRIGRTGRAGRTGRSISFWRPRERGHLHGIERLSGQPMTAWRLPNERELAARRRERFTARLRDLAAAAPDPDVAELLAELTSGDPSPTLERLAAAAVRLAWGEGPLALPPAPPPAPKRKRDREPRAERPARGRGQDRSGQDEVEIVLPVGAKSRVRPGHVVGAITGESGLPGSVVGAIRVLERVTFVGIAAEHVDAVLAALDGKQVGGRAIRPRRAHPEGGDERRAAPAAKGARRKGAPRPGKRARRAAAEARP